MYKESWSKMAKNIFEKYFHIEEARVDKGLLFIEEGELFANAKAFFDYQYAIDASHRRMLSVVEVNRQKSVILPRSVRNRSKVAFAGVKPIFAAFDKHFNLITYMFVGSIIRVEYLGIKDKAKKVKYFKYL